MKKVVLLIFVLIGAVTLYAQDQTRLFESQTRNCISEQNNLLPEYLVKEYKAISETSGPVFKEFSLKNPFEETCAEPTADQWLPDSVRLYALTDSTLRRFVYDDQTRIIEEVTLSWNGTSYENNKRTTYQYETKSRIIRVLEDNWKYGDWTANAMREYSYEVLIDTIKAPAGTGEDVLWMVVTNYSWDLTQYAPYIRTTYAFDAADYLTAHWSENFEGGSWVPSYKTKNVWNASYDIVSTTMQEWVTGVWEYVSKTSYFYDANEKMTQQLSQNYNFGWENSWNTLYSWTGDDNTETIEQTWDAAAWNNLRRTSITFDANHHRLLEASDTWDGSAWAANQRRAYTWSGDNLTEQVYESYSGGNYVPTSKVTFDFQSGSVHAQGWVWDGAAWIASTSGSSLLIYAGGYTYYLGYGSDGVFYYSRAVDVADVPVVPERFAVSQNFPNPFNPSTSLSVMLPSNSFTTASVYSVTGEKIALLLNKELPAGVHTISWDAASLPSGVYFIRVEAVPVSGGSSFSKIVKAVKLN